MKKRKRNEIVFSSIPQDCLQIVFLFMEYKDILLNVILIDKYTHFIITDNVFPKLYINMLISSYKNYIDKSNLKLLIHLYPKTYENLKEYIKIFTSKSSPFPKFSFSKPLMELDKIYRVFDNLERLMMESIIKQDEGNTYCFYTNKELSDLHTSFYHFFRFYDNMDILLFNDNYIIFQTFTVWLSNFCKMKLIYFKLNKSWKKCWENCLKKLLSRCMEYLKEEEHYLTCLTKVSKIFKSLS